jgi:hypothetical protein
MKHIENIVEIFFFTFLRPNVFFPYDRRQEGESRGADKRNLTFTPNVADDKNKTKTIFAPSQKS